MSFCSHCGRPAAAGDVRMRICAFCGLGVILQTNRALAPTPGEAFLVADGDLLICAISDGAEGLLARGEADVIHRPLGDLVSGIEHDGEGRPLLPELVHAAVIGGAGVVDTTVSLIAGTGEQYTVRLGSCGPPEAALLVINGPVPLTGAMD